MTTRYAKKQGKADFPIRINKALAKRLKKFGVMGESYSDVIERLLFEKKAKDDKDTASYMDKIDG
jgi:predicted CopG family antitoxin